MRVTERIQGLKQILLLLLIMSLAFTTQAQDFKKVVDLKGNWKFSIGDNLQWSDPDYNDTHWERIRVPGSWEGQGFHGYDGYAWYRTTTYLESDQTYGAYYLKLGYIDDVDEVYINGIKFGQTGNFPPNYTTAYNAFRLYRIPNKILGNGRQIHIAVRVFDEGGEGGVIHGDISLVMDLSSIHPDLDLQGDWKFKTGNCSGIPEKLVYQNWENIIVPGAWEDQGYKKYDGYACYVTEFNLEGQFPDDRMVLLLGYIDDLDKVYLNGTLIGQSGPFKAQTVYDRSDYYLQARGYYIPLDILKNNGKNVLVVKVFDNGGLGGIWKGTVGLISQYNYIQYWHNKRNANR